MEKDFPTGGRKAESADRQLPQGGMTMTKLFATVLEMSLTGSFVIAVVVVLRLIGA